VCETYLVLYGGIRSVLAKDLNGFAESLPGGMMQSCVAKLEMKLRGNLFVLSVHVGSATKQQANQLHLALVRGRVQLGHQLALDLHLSFWRQLLLSLLAAASAAATSTVGSGLKTLMREVADLVGSSYSLFDLSK